MGLIFGESRDYHGRFAGGGLGGSANNGLVISKLDAASKLAIKTEEEGNAIGDYAGGSSGPLNTFLRSGGKDAYFARQAGHIDSVIQRVHTTGDLFLFRGLHGVSPSSGSIFTDSAFASTTLSEDVARQFAKGGTLMRIHYPRGGNALSINSIMSYDSDVNESEILLPRRLRYKILHVAKAAAADAGAFEQVMDVAVLAGEVA
jgi:hypothetical protein